jgi:thioredoxin-related protein
MFNALLKFGATAALVIATSLPAGAVELGEDGLHKPAWLEQTFMDLRDDLAEANALGRRMMIIVEQRGCIYCSRMHEETFVDPEIERLLSEDFYVVQMNLFGNLEVTDFDGVVMEERNMATHWGVVFTPTMIFFPDDAPESGGLRDAAVMTMPGAFGRGTTQAMLNWILEHGYDGEEHFQHYVARVTGN